MQEMTLKELCAATNVEVRTARYYMQIGLLDKPIGETRAAKYTAKHLEQLLLINKWSSSGLALDSIREILHGAPDAIPPERKKPGDISVKSHIAIAPGIELVIDSSQNPLSGQAIRQLAQLIIEHVEENNR